MNQPNQPPPNPDSPYPQQTPPGQFQQQMPPGQYSPYPPKKPGMNTGLKVGLIIGGVVLGMVVLFVLVGALAVVAVTPKLAEAKQKLDAKQVGDLTAALQEISFRDDRRGELDRYGELAGWELWAALFKDGVIDSRLTERLVSMGRESDTKASNPGSVTARNCSFTLPRADELLDVMEMTGDQRCVLICFNSRNWNNYPERGVLVQWTDGASPEYMTFEQANRDWGITQEEWADPAGKLFGKKAPFHYVHE